MGTLHSIPASGRWIQHTVVPQVPADRSAVREVCCDESGWLNPPRVDFWHGVCQSQVFRSLTDAAELPNHATVVAPPLQLTPEPDRPFELDDGHLAGAYRLSRERP